MHTTAFSHRNRIMPDSETPWWAEDGLLPISDEPRLNWFWTQVVTQSARNRQRDAKERGIETTDLKPWAIERFKELDGRCAISGIPFSTEKRGDGQAPRPWMPSIHRVSREAGYVEGNVELVCWIVNLALHTWSEVELLEMACAITRKHDT
jgi:hypothetical protein